MGPSALSLCDFAPQKRLHDSQEKLSADSSSRKVGMTKSPFAQNSQQTEKRTNVAALTTTTRTTTTRATTNSLTCFCAEREMFLQSSQLS